jgi:hypothetical protein
MDGWREGGELSEGERVLDRWSYSDYYCDCEGMKGMVYI